MNMKVLAIALLLTGCASGEVRHTTYDGIPVIEHIDTTTDRPDDCPREHRAGCYKLMVANGALGHHVWYSSVSPAYVGRHEIAHAKGMWHTAWARHPLYGNNCATVTAGVEGYPLGSLVCNDGRKEWVVERGTI